MPYLPTLAPTSRSNRSWLENTIPTFETYIVRNLYIWSPEIYDHQAKPFSVSKIIQ